MPRFTTILTAIALFSVPVLAYSAPWLSPGDARARHSVQKLSDRGHLEATTTTWPIMWADLEQRGSAPADSSVGMQRAYLGFEKEQQANSGFRSEVELEGSTTPPYLRGFNQLPREDGQLTATLQWQG